MSNEMRDEAISQIRQALLKTPRDDGWAEEPKKGAVEDCVDFIDDRPNGMEPPVDIGMDCDGDVTAVWMHDKKHLGVVYTMFDGSNTLSYYYNVGEISHGEDDIPSDRWWDDAKFIDALTRLGFDNNNPPKPQKKKTKRKRK